MSIETYWTVAPIIGNVLTVPFWAWLIYTTRSKRQHEP